MTQRISQTAVARTKPWHFSLMQSEALYRLLEDTLMPLGNCALVLPGGQALHVCPAGPADLTTLPQAAALGAQYLRLGDGDAAIMNDPLSGGTLLSEITLVIGVITESGGGGSGEADLLLARRLSLPVRLSEKDRLSDQGVRIPPTPLAQSGQINSELLTAIASHPFAPAGIGSAVHQGLEEMKRVSRQLKNIAADPQTGFRRGQFKPYLEDCARTFENLLSRLPLGTALTSTQIVTGEVIKLKLEISEKSLHFDFGGTDTSVNLSLTEVACFGACIAATAQLIGQPIPFNAGSFEHIHVSTPAKTLVSSRGNEGFFSGMTSGIEVIGGLVQNAFVKLNPALRSLAQQGTDGFFEFRFAHGSYTGRIAPGNSARKSSRGVDAFSVWASRSPGLNEDASIEAIERKWPVKFILSGIHNGSGGKGRWTGGNGNLLALSVLAPSEFRWSFGQSSQGAQGRESGRAGADAMIEIIRVAENGTQATKEKISQATGFLKLQQNDQIFIYGPGGGGFGEAHTSS